MQINFQLIGRLINGIIYFSFSISVILVILCLPLLL